MLAFIRLWRNTASIALALASVWIGAALAVPPPGPFAALEGAWSGAGQIRLDNGRSESLKCKARYQTRGGGAALGLALRCASVSNRIDLHADLRSAGGRVAGTWEERSFSISGTAAGRAAGNSIRLAINGGPLSGSMAVTTNGASQSISLRTDGAALQGVSISLRRD